MAHIELLESRRLLATLRPDVTWADDGFLDRRTFSNFLSATRANILTIDFPDRISRYTAEGRRDQGFHDISLNVKSRAAVDARGRVYVVNPGYVDLPSLVRYTADGQLDTTWGQDGLVDLDIDLGDARVADLPRVTLTADGSVYLHVSYDSTFYDAGSPVAGGKHDRVYKFTNAGRPDTTFADNGIIDFSSENAKHLDFVWTGVQSDGHVIFVQASTNGGAFVARYTAKGRLDKTYGSYAASIFPSLRGKLSSRGIALDSHDRLILVEPLDVERPGPETTEFAYDVRRFTAAGRPDRAFGSNGVAVIAATALTTAGGGDSVLLPQRDGKLIVQLASQVLCLKPSGLVDRSFAPGGASDLDVTSTNLVGQLPDGSLLADVSFEVPRRYLESVARLADSETFAQGNSGTLYLRGTDDDDTLILYSAGRRVGTAADLNGVRLGVFKGITAIVADLGAGNDRYVDEFNDVSQSVLGGAGNDHIVTADGNDGINAGAGDDTVQSNGGFDGLDLDTGNATVDAGSGGGEIGLLPGDDDRVSVRGAGGDWSLSCYGGRADITLTGASATLYLSGRHGSAIDVRTTDGATIEAGDGSDSIVTGDGNDSIRPGAGNDTVVSGNGNDTVASEDELYDTLTGLANDVYDLGAGNDVAADMFGNNTILGGDGDDSIRTGGGRDNLSGDAGRDTLRGSQGNDTLIGGGGRDRLFGYEGDDLLRGGGNDDTLYGGGGDDTLEGGCGNNVLR